MMNPKREQQLRENLFGMWFELLRRECETTCSPMLYGTADQLESEYKILEESKQVLRDNFIKHYHISDEIHQREEENERLLKELEDEQAAE